MFYLLI